MRNKNKTPQDLEDKKIKDAVNVVFSAVQKVAITVLSAVIIGGITKVGFMVNKLSQTVERSHKNEQELVENRTWMSKSDDIHRMTISNQRHILSNQKIITCALSEIQGKPCKQDLIVIPEMP